MQIRPRCKYCHVLKYGDASTAKVQIRKWCEYDPDADTRMQMRRHNQIHVPAKQQLWGNQNSQNQRQTIWQCHPQVQCTVMRRPTARCFFVRETCLRHPGSGALLCCARDVALQHQPTHMPVFLVGGRLVSMLPWRCGVVVHTMPLTGLPSQHAAAASIRGGCAQRPTMFIHLPGQWVCQGQVQARVSAT
jgi:hypothetical protein